MIHSEEEFHMDDTHRETEESYHIGSEENRHAGTEESCHVGSEESYHIGSEESFHIGDAEGSQCVPVRDGEGVTPGYTVSEDGNSLVIDAVDEAVDVVQDFVAGKLKACGCDNRIMLQIRLVVEEIFVNIISYAYRQETGKAEVFCEVSEDPLTVCIRFMDSGRPFDPLARDEADTSGKMFREREGGFGIHLVKHTMDDVEYAYSEGKNILTVRKRLPSQE